jgi:hypothetical protein
MKQRQLAEGAACVARSGGRGEGRRQLGSDGQRGDVQVGVELGERGGAGLNLHGARVYFRPLELAATNQALKGSECREL